MSSKYLVYYQIPKSYLISASQKNSFRLLSRFSNFGSKNNTDQGTTQILRNKLPEGNNEFIQSKHKTLYTRYKQQGERIHLVSHTFKDCCHQAHT